MSAPLAVLLLVVAVAVPVYVVLTVELARCRRTRAAALLAARTSAHGTRNGAAMRSAGARRADPTPNPTHRRPDGATSPGRNPR